MPKAFSAEVINFGRKVKKLRLKKNMTQQSLADACEVDIRTIQRIEKGQYGCGLHLLFALGKALDTSASKLVAIPTKGLPTQHKS